MSSATQTNTCCICLESAQTRGGVPIISPGCCGKWFHQSCIDELIANGNDKCPACRTPFPNNNNVVPTSTAAVNNAPPAPRRSFLGGLFGNRNINGNVLPPQPMIQQQVPQQQLPMQQQQIQQQPFHLFGNNASINRYQRSNESDITEEVISEEPPQVGVKVNSNQSAAIEPNVSVVTSPEYTQASINENHSFHVRVSLKNNQIEEIVNDKVPLDVVCILDNSGSMEGSKIESLKNAMKFVISNLSAKDRLSVVYFNSYAGGIHGLLKMNGSNKDKAFSKLATLEAGGGTDIYAGMQLGWSILQNRTTKNPASCVFLLTDGQDGSNFDAKKELARTMKANGTSLFVFGFGADHDSAHMSGIAQAAEGSFIYVDTDDTVVDAFGGAIGTQQGVSIRNVTLSINCVADNIKLVEAMSGSYVARISEDKRSVNVSFANLYMGENRDVLLRLQLPAVTAENTNYPLLSCNASYSIQGTTLSEPVRTPSVICNIQRLRDENIDTTLLVRDIEVDIQINRMLSTNAINEALRHADNGDMNKAKEILQTAMQKVTDSNSYKQQNLITLGIIEDLTDALSRVRSRQEYSAGGRAMMSEAMMQNAQQRNCYSKAGKIAKYQTSSSSVSQNNAKLSKN